jgi:predicted ATPase
MIREISVSGYKCFREIVLSVPSLAVFTGVNGVGKSAFIQALLLAWQSGGSNGSDGVLPLNGQMFEFGCAGEVSPHYSNFPHTIEISWRFSEFSETFHCRLTAKSYDDRFLYSTKAIDETIKKNVVWSGLGGFTFLGAERSGPLRFSARQSMNKESLFFGSKGEFCADIISMYDSMPVQNKGIVLEHIDGLRYPDGYSKQIEAWMHNLGFSLQIRPKPSAVKDIAALEFLDGQFPEAEWINPVHTGFGISYSLPIIAAGLIAQPEGVLIVESPEAHLHPAAQSKMGGFLARLASTGVQVFVETHSDHILNGIRLAAVRGDIEKEDILFVAFSKSSDGSMKAENIRIGEGHSLSAWPKGFFDQIQSDLGEIAARRRL